MRYSIIAALLLWSLPVQAQDIEKEATRPTRAVEKQDRAATAAEAAAKNVAPGDDIRYEDVLKKPDDPELNYRFARAQVRRGDLKGAAATLERLLLVSPNQTTVRLFYAIVLYRLDNLGEAARELALIKKRSVPESLQAEFAKYEAAVDKARKKTRIAGRLSSGVQYDDNRNASPSSGQRLFVDAPINLTGANRRQSDTAFLIMAGLDVNRDLGFQAGHEAFGRLSYYSASQTDQRTLSLQAYSAQAGAALKHGRYTVTPAAQFDHILLSEYTFLRNSGGSLRLDRSWRRTNLFVEGRMTYEDFRPTPRIVTAHERRGNRYDFSAGGDRLLRPDMRLSLAALGGVKNAEREYNAYNRLGLRATHTWLLGRGSFLLSDFTLNYDRYDDPDVLISRDHRRDTTFRLASTIGAPLSALGASRLKDLLLTFTYEYYDAESTVRNYEYSNNKVVGMLTYRWEAGL